MPRVRSPNRDKAFEIYKEHNGKIDLVEIAKILNCSPGTIRGWKNKDSWDKKINGTFQKKYKKNTERSKRNKGGQPGNKNAVGNSGGSAPPGNLNAIKHGAYQSLYANMLSNEEKALYEQMTATVNIDEEIRLLRLKIARLLNRDKTFFYDMFGRKHTKELSEEDRENGILACMDQLRKLIETKAAIAGDTEKLQIEKEKFEFQKYKDEIKLELEKEKLAIAKRKAGDDDEELHDDGFLDALEGATKEVWDDYEEE
ncbi:terminase [Crassaminicella thermophila]|uniref:Terminase n=1 Tax=Crassaminicella thermophila TaxID=2599308 RepID=A0A5C0SIF3_CRATE|nr:phage terminase small subunit [Crassaminicella thermophila]QEK12729.1 terminase [Crassaminicella thermophila]